jgi:hypothetical protein
MYPQTCNFIFKQVHRLQGVPSPLTILAVVIILKLPQVLEEHIHDAIKFHSVWAATAYTHNKISSEDST